MQASNKATLSQVLTDVPEPSLLSRVYLQLIVGTVAVYCILSIAVVAATPHSNFELGQTEQLCCLCVLCMQVGSLLHDAFVLHNFSEDGIWFRRVIRVVKVISTLTNLAIYTLPSPFVIDAVTGRPNSMLRLVEWTALSFTLTYIVEAVVEKEPLMPMLTAASQSLSTFCGLLLPYVSGWLLVWSALLALSLALFSFIFWRLYVKTKALEGMRMTQQSDSFELRKFELGTRLLWRCVRVRIKVRAKIRVKVRLRVQGSEFRIQDSGFRIQDSGFRSILSQVRSHLDHTRAHMDCRRGRSFLRLVLGDGVGLCC